MNPVELFTYDMFDGINKCKKLVHGNVKYATSLRGRKMYGYILELERFYGTDYYMSHQRIGKQMSILKRGFFECKPTNELNAYFHYLWLAIESETLNENIKLKKVMI